VIVVSYGVYSQPELDLHEPRVVHVDDDNRILRVDADPSAIAAQP
jgi:aspartate 1-decarboxylase